MPDSFSFRLTRPLCVATTYTQRCFIDFLEMTALPGGSTTPDPTPGPVATTPDATPEPTPDPIPEPVATIPDATPEPTPDATPELVATIPDATPEPVAPTPDPTPDPVATTPSEVCVCVFCMFQYALFEDGEDNRFRVRTELGFEQNWGYRLDLTASDVRSKRLKMGNWGGGGSIPSPPHPCTHQKHSFSQGTEDK